MRRFTIALVALSALVAAGCAREQATPTAPAPTPTLVSTAAHATPTTQTGGPPAGTITQAFFLQVTTPANESVVRTATIEVKRRTTPDAVVSVEGQVAQVDADGGFASTITPQPGPNAIDVIANDFHGNHQGAVVTVVYNP